MASYGIPDILNYFDSSEINLSLRIAVPNKKAYKDIHDTIDYEWILCDESDKPVVSDSDSRFHFYDTQGKGSFDLATRKRPKSESDKERAYGRYENRASIMLFKRRAVRIGTLSKLGNYKVAMRFTDSLGNQSDYLRMAQFNILNKDQFRHRLLLIILGAIAAGGVAAVAATCGIGTS